MKLIPDEVRERLTQPLKELPIPSKKNLRLAMRLAEQGLSDLDSAKANYKSERFANAANDLQQSVEKGAKAFGLLIGTVEPTDQDLKYKKGVGHLAFRAFILRFENFHPKWLNLVESMYQIAQMKIVDTFFTKGFIKMLEAAEKTIRQWRLPTSKMSAEIDELLKLDEETMWNATLYLDTTNKWVSEAVNGMKQPLIFNNNLKRSINLAAGLLKKTGVFSDDDVQRIKFAGNLSRASQKLFPLSLLTTWHHEKASYSTIGRGVQRGSSVYKKGVPYVDEMPNYIKTARGALEGIVGACKSATE